MVALVQVFDVRHLASVYDHFEESDDGTFPIPLCSGDCDFGKSTCLCMLSSVQVRPHIMKTNQIYFNRF